MVGARLVGIAGLPSWALQSSLDRFEPGYLHHFSRRGRTTVGAVGGPKDQHQGSAPPDAVRPSIYSISR